MSADVFVCANGQSTERNIAEVLMLRLGLDVSNHRERDPLVLLAGRQLEEERLAAAKVCQPPTEETPTATALLPLLRSLQTYPQDFQEVIRRMLALSQATHRSARCLLESGEAGLASTDNVARLIADLQLALRELSAVEGHRIWQIPGISRDANKQVKHNRHKLGPICDGCFNQIGFYLDNTYLGSVPLLGRNFRQMKPGDRLELGTKPAQVLTVKRIEGLMVHLHEPGPAQPPTAS